MIAAHSTEIHNTDSIEARVTEHFTYLHGILQNLERKILDSLQEHRSSHMKNIDDVFTQLKEHEYQLQTARVVITSISENLDKINLQQVMPKLKKLIDIPCHVVLNSTPDNEEIRFNVDLNIIEAIEKHCNIHIPKTSNFSLQPTELLPDDYEIEPLIKENIPKSNVISREMINSSLTLVSLPPTKTDNFLCIGSSKMVRVSHVVDPSCFYVQLVQNQQKILELSKNLTLLANSSSIIPTEITFNALYVVKYSKDNAWYRGRVTSENINLNRDVTYNVVFIDYGMKEEDVPLTRIRNIVPQFAMLPVMALRCTLYDIVPKKTQWQPEAIEAFKKLICINAMVSICIMMITGDTYYVDLCVISSKDSGLISVKESLTYMKYATCISTNKLKRTNPDSMRKYYKEQLDIKDETAVQILFVESPSSIYVQKRHANRSHFTKMTLQMTEEYEQNLYSTELIPIPYKHLPCAARGVDGLWHRGIIDGVTENNIKVFYVDLGYTLMLNYDAARVLSPKYMSYRAQAIKVSLKNIKPHTGYENQWDPEAKQFLKKFLLKTKNFKVVAFDIIGETYNVSMYTYDEIDVGNLLISYGFALTKIGPGSYDGNTNKKSGKRKNKFKKNISSTHFSGELYDDPVISNMKKKSIEESEDPFKICVLIHQVRSPDCIYVSDVTCQTNMKQMTQQMQDFYSKYYSAKKNIWSQNDTCAVYSAKNDMYYRGHIVDIKSPDKVIVFLYDIGVEETVTMNDIQALCSTFFKIPKYVFKIKLSGILPCGGTTTWPTLSCEKLHEIINNNHGSKFYISKLEEEQIEDSTIQVELWLKQVKMDGPLDPTRHEINSVNRILVEKGVALPIKEYSKKRDRILAIELKRQLAKRLELLAKCEPNVKWFQINTNLEDSVLPLNSEAGGQDYNMEEEILENIPSIGQLSTWLPAKPIIKDAFIAIPTFLDDNCFLYLHSKNEGAETLQHIETNLQKLYNNSPIESCNTVWIEGDICIAQYHTNKKWYRGKVMKIQENDIIDVEFVDYGNVEKCLSGTLKKKIALQDIPIQCTKCLIYGLNSGNENGVWITEDLDKIHGLLVDHECEVTVIDRTKTHLIISLRILPNKYCRQKSDLITFLIDEWKMNINPTMDTTISENSLSSTVTPDVVENIRSFYSDDKRVTDDVVSGHSILSHIDAVNKDESYSTTDIENLSWINVKDEAVTSTPHVVSEENLSIKYKLANIPEDVDYIEIELCCSISPTEFYAHLKENIHSMDLHMNYTQYEHLMKDLQENAYKQSLITNLNPNTPCCAKFNDNLWYRCLIVESEPIKDSDDIEIKLFYVDYGNDEYRTVNSQQCELYTLKKEWIDIPTMAMKCKLWNIKVSSTVDYNTLLPYLEKMYDKCVIAIVKDTNEEFLSIELYNEKECKTLMYNALIEKGLFQTELTD
ncbi:RING finger protein 17 [Habropoda laboriosa]|uniref:RING finger protein 17 n=1 Tax=Habropoda laboriosa TaxID=597456 RepID=A0A0L7QPZ0_9HYME|nr:PREDICTED: RING finger protein 17-like [Habropoda laboriosa]KOC60697.1 RING finger protein 17 [Habropoda laboriosa]